ncbi:histidine phosphatase superfamily [Xylaria palmicola]|nr:histidine phosphatase superfamily [Xylaria palmicola]
MAPTIHVIRHAQAQHQINQDYTLRDTELTPLGIEQSKALAGEIAKLDIDFVYASPLRRSIMTAFVAFAIYSQSRPIFLFPDLQEVSDNPVDIGHTQSELEAEFGTDHFDYLMVEPGWTDKHPWSRYSPINVENRARDARVLLRKLAEAVTSKPNPNIAVVSHGNFIWELTKSSDTPFFRNTEIRSYQFDPSRPDDADAELIETASSIARRGGVPKA